MIDPDLLRILRPPVRTSAVEWPERHRELTRGARPGPYRHRNAPYLRGIIKLASTPGIVEINLKKSAQGGGSEACRCLIAYWAHHEPDPVGLALPNRQKGEQIIKDDVIPIFRQTPVLQALMTDDAHDITKQEIKLLNGFTLYLMWAGSPTSLAVNPMRRAICDEVNKFDAWTGEEAHAIDLVAKRLRTYEDRALQINISTPTTSYGAISIRFESCTIKLYFLVECPHCLRRQRLIWDQVKFAHYHPPEPENSQWADRIMREDAAWYECRACKARIDERAKRRIVQHGRWGTIDGEGFADGVIDDAEAVERWPRGTRIGMHFSALYCMWVRFSDVAAEYIRALGDLTRQYDWVTGTLGEDFRQHLKIVKPSKFEAKSLNARLAEGIVPAWAAALIATIDTQQDGFWLVIRAWGPGLRSQLIFQSWVTTEDELDKWLWGNPWSVEGDRFPPMVCSTVWIDSGGTREAGKVASRTMDVYRYVQSRPQVQAIKGDSKPVPGLFMRRGKGWLKTAAPGASSVEVPLFLIDTHHFQNQLAELIDREIRTGEGEDLQIEEAWQLNQRNDPIYNAHMANLVSSAIRRKAMMVEEWAPIREGARVDLRHCEGYQVAAAYRAGMHLLPSIEHFMAMKDAAYTKRKRRADQPAGSKWIDVGGEGGPGGWL